MSMNNGVRKTALALAFLMSCSSTGALAQTIPASTASSGSPPNGDIVVTATRQRQSLSKVPLSVVAFSKKQMDSEGVRTIADLSRLTPGLSLTPIGSNDVSGANKTISIRGIASNVGSPTTGIYIDDTPIQTRALGNVSSNVYPQVFDLERVEVLRGPQGTLFGAGAEGGVVRFITTQPDLNSITGYGRAELAFTKSGAPSNEGGAAIGVPIVEDKLAIRVAAWYRRDGGYVNRVDPTSSEVIDKNSNSQDSYSLRGSIKWQPVPDFHATLSIFHQDEKVNDASTFYQSYSDLEKSQFNAARVAPSTSNDRFTLPTLNMQYDASWFSLIATTSLFRRSVHRSVDYSNFVASLLLDGPYNYGGGEESIGHLDDKQHDFTQEIRIQSSSGGRFNWVVGGFYSHSKQATYQYNIDASFNTARERLGLSPFDLLDGVSTYETRASSVDEQKAVFGQLDYELFRGFRLTAGLRYAAIDLKAQRSSLGPLASVGGDFSESRSEHPLTPKAGLSYQASSSTLVYATASKGYRIGGVNSPQSTLCAASLTELGLSSSPDSYKSDSLWSYEAGLKTKLLDGKLRLEASIFDIYWKNIQRQVSLTACGASFVTNFGKARSTGFDLQAEVNPFKNMNIGGSIGYADARLTRDVLGETNSVGSTTVYGLSGDKIGGPPWTWTLFGEYQIPITDSRTLYARADYQHVGAGAKIDDAVYGIDPAIAPTQAYDQVSLRAGLRAGGLDVSVFVQNLLDQSPLLYRYRYTTAYDTLFQESTLRPRTVGLTGTYMF